MNLKSMPKKELKTFSLSLTVFFFLMVCFSTLFFSTSCRLYRMEKKLDPVNAEFLSKVRYIITKEESKIFLELPSSVRADFIEKFWKKRDPNPSTEINEYRNAYFSRIEEANRLFRGGGHPGWLQDRGRIFILFGPPNERLTNPMGGQPVDPYADPREMIDSLWVAKGENPTEIWFYGDLPILFRHRTCTGQYELASYDLTLLRYFNLMYMNELNLDQVGAQNTLFREKKFFDSNWKLQRQVSEADRFEGTLLIEVAYKKIWFTAKEKILETTIELSLEMFDSSQGKAWQFQKDLFFSLTEVYPSTTWFYQGIVEYGLPNASNVIFFNRSGIGGCYCQLCNKKEAPIAWEKSLEINPKQEVKNNVEVLND